MRKVNEKEMYSRDSKKRVKKKKKWKQLQSKAETLK
jgi:hypothetical protein